MFHTTTTATTTTTEHEHEQDFKGFKERMALVPLRFVDGDDLADLAKAKDAVFVLSIDTDTDTDVSWPARVVSFVPALP